MYRLSFTSGKKILNSFVSTLLIFVISFLNLFVLIPIQRANAQTSQQWIQTTQADFDTGEKVNVDTASSPGDAKLTNRQEIDSNKPTIAAGYYEIVGVKNDGTVNILTYFTSWFTYGISSWTNIKSVAVGSRGHTVGLKEDGTVVAVGRNNEGQLNVSSWNNIKAIAAGDYHTVGLKEDGTVVAIGVEGDQGIRNNYGQINVSNWTNIKAIAAGSRHTVGLKKDGTVVAVGNNQFGQLNVSGWTNIKAIAAGQQSTIGLKADGTVIVAGGWPMYGSLDTSSWTNIKAIAAGSHHVLGLKNDGTVVGVGWNFYGQLDNIDSWTDITAIAGGVGISVGLKSDGTTVDTGWIFYVEPNVSTWTNIRQPSYINAFPYSGNLTSPVLDTERASNFETLNWNATVPQEAGTDAVKFQIATNNDNSTWNFVGPDGTSNTYYTTSGQPTWQGHSGNRYIKYKLYFSTANDQYTPVLHDVTVTYKPYDTTPPEITVLSPEQRDYDISEDITVNYLATDDLSGVASTSAAFDGQTVENGQTIDLFSLPIGQHNFTVTATDNTGNTSTKEVVFNTVATPESTITVIEELLSGGEIISSGTATSLISQLSGALSSIDSGNEEAAIGQLNSFINLIEAQSGNRIDADTAALLIQAAQTMLDNL